MDFRLDNNDTRDRILPTLINGQSPASQLTNGILGGWAVSLDRFITYVPGVGLTALGYNNSTTTSNVNLAAAGPTDNVQDDGALGVTTRTINSIRFTTNNAVTNMASPTDTLTVATGGVLENANDPTFNVGRLTSGISNLYINTYAEFVINGTIVNNGSNPVTLVKSLSSNLVLTVTNTYSGGTVVNCGNLIPAPPRR